MEDAFDVVIPSMPGYGFSGKPQSKRPPGTFSFLMMAAIRRRLCRWARERHAERAAAAAGDSAIFQEWGASKDAKKINGLQIGLTWCLCSDAW